MAGTPVPGSAPIAAAPKGTTVEQLLTPSGPQPNDGFVHLGTLRVEKAIFDDFKTAQQYLAKSPEALNQLYALEHGRTGIDVRSTAIGKDEFGSRDGRPTISWAPKGALLNTDGSTLTPAMGLVHEQGHANQWLSDPQQYAKDAAPYPARLQDYATWTTPEEKRNITGLEDRVGKALGEGHRDDHHGRPYTSRGPISVESEAHKLVAGRIAALGQAGKPVPALGAGNQSVVPFDGKPHTGSFVDMGNGEMAQNVGRGTYMVYDVAKDLGGVRPPEAQNDVTVDAQGHQQGRPAPAHALSH